MGCSSRRPFPEERGVARQLAFVLRMTQLALQPKLSDPQRFKP